MHDFFHLRGGAAVGLGAMDFPLVAAEVEGFLEHLAGIGGDAHLQLAGAVASRIEVEVGLHLARGVDLDAGEVLQRRGTPIVQRGELAEGGPNVGVLAVRGDMAEGMLDIVPLLPLNSEGGEI